MSNISIAHLSKYIRVVDVAELPPKAMYNMPNKARIKINEFKAFRKNFPILIWKERHDYITSADNSFNACFAGTIVGGFNSILKPLKNTFTLRHETYNYNEILSLLLLLKYSKSEIIESITDNGTKEKSKVSDKISISKKDDLTIITFEELPLKVRINVGNSWIEIDPNKTITFSM